MNSCEQNYSKAGKKCLVVLYTVTNCHPYLYGREFVLTCDYESVHWMTYINNPGAKLLRWRLRFQDYQYKFEYKQGKLNRVVEALSENLWLSNDTQNLLTQLTPTILTTPINPTNPLPCKTTLKTLRAPYQNLQTSERY